MKPKRQRKIRKCYWLPAFLVSRLAQESARQHMTQTRLVEDALRAFFPFKP